MDTTNNIEVWKIKFGIDCNYQTNSVMPSFTCHSDNEDNFCFILAFANGQNRTVDLLLMSNKQTKKSAFDVIANYYEDNIYVYILNAYAHHTVSKRAKLLGENDKLLCARVLVLRGKQHNKKKPRFTLLLPMNC